LRDRNHIMPISRPNMAMITHAMMISHGTDPSRAGSMMFTLVLVLTTFRLACCPSAKRKRARRWFPAPGQRPKGHDERPPHH
jgi:hypothetical protein